jgi:hypothetical protein
LRRSSWHLIYARGRAGAIEFIVMPAGCGHRPTGIGVVNRMKKTHIVFPIRR